MTQRRLELVVSGTVQGVGFRPFVYWLAHELGFAGFVCNRQDGVLIEIEGPSDVLAVFQRRLSAELPPAAAIEDIRGREITPRNEDGGFTIAASPDAGRRRITIGADTAVCPACLEEMRDPADRRYAYPFINCTECGPRLTIIRDLPYDRRRTAMADFPLCEDCRREYDDPLNRRFHAEATACPVCGPRLEFLAADGQTLGQGKAALSSARKCLLEGKILAVKGLGGFHLALRADDQAAVEELRRRKRRPAKPLALMVRDPAMAEEIVVLDAAEKKLISSAAAPIVLARRRENCALVCPAVAPGLVELGVMLPYTPLHHLLLADDLECLVMTSANLSDEPIVIDNREALQRLNGIADGFLVHDREIVVRLDDSVAMVADGEVSLLRRSRGYAPRSLPLPRKMPRPTLALGGELKASICLAHGERALLSPHIGDLETPEARSFLHENIELLQKIAAVKPELIVCDLHPGYYTSWLAEQFAGVEILRLQHHQAHILSCMAEHQLDGPVLGLAMDGTGYGQDGQVWGGEFLAVAGRDCRRLVQIDYFPLPGAELAIRQPWRIALALLQETFPEDYLEIAAELVLAPPGWSPAQLDMIAGQRLNCPQCSSLGRFFDAVAALFGLGRQIDYEAQAAIELESLARTAEFSASPEGEISWLYPFAVEENPSAAADDSASGRLLNLRPLFAAVVDDLLQHRRSPAEIAMLFHHSVIEALMRLACQLAEKENLARIVLSGGCFQNRLLLSGCRAWPARNPNAAKLQLFSHQQLPTNDGGLALGQIYYALQG